MSDDELMLFAALKFGDLLRVTEAFAEAINSPTYVRNQYVIEEKDVVYALRYWLREGAPKKLEITNENVDMILKAKFGSIQNAFRYWMHLDPYKETYLSDKEYQRLMDYIESKTPSTT